ncbi:hypothetical protein [Serratia fonticola]|uniref:hypothetical protein n=1 Tax=Serratia fonticola TaxID=47917 RepID=UPI001C459B29|nr:hypothetical protein [Serratia fonticola]QXN62802.1 hypothetical protein J8M99_01615 [Serratia fonticola]
MLDRQAIELTLISAAQQQGLTLNGKDLLDIRTNVSMALAAKEKWRQRMVAPSFQWKKPAPRR